VNGSELRKVLFLAPSVCVFLFVCEISRALNGLAPNSQGIRVWSVFRSEQFEDEGQRPKVKVTRDKKRTFFGPFGGLRVVYAL